MATGYELSADHCAPSDSYPAWERFVDHLPLAIENGLPGGIGCEESRKEMASTGTRRRSSAGWFKRNAAVISIVISLLSPLAVVRWVVTHVVNDAIDSNLRESGIAKLPNEVSSLESRINELDKDVHLLLGNALKTTATLAQPAFNQNLKVVSTQLQLAKNDYAVLEQSVTESIREKLVASDRVNEEALWDARTSFISYESHSLNPTVQVSEITKPCMAGNVSYKGV